ncbi:TonB-dependent receptor [Sphingobium chlorophenolicum L-1]|uniref:TonB-dependent receptor n=2 Tax=Sphingobium chlorophenolicum TaxID=46429 RepID=F6F3A4_SPHCR|nr:TonB-dependent receptor [Sphingobium chlorophenolicum L-1]
MRQARKVKWMVGIAMFGTALSTSALAREAEQVGGPQAAADQSAGEIVVTARKREETLMSVPVVVSAISGAQLVERGIANLDGIARAVPQLLIAASGNSTQGGTVAIRGVSGPDILSLADQAVAFNIDGIQVARSTVRRMSETDLAQVEVLRGPQALFYGKNSPGGIITLRSRDPGDHVEMGGSVGYEINAREIRGEAYVSGPVSDTIGVRLAGIVSTMDGWMKDATPASNPFKSENSRNPQSTDYALRGTVKWEPSPDFDATVKLNYGRLDSAGIAGTTSYIACNPAGRRALAGLPCSAGDRNTVTQTGNITVTPYAHPRSDREPFADQKQFLGSLNLAGNLSDTLRLSSITGYYSSRLDHCGNVLGDPNVGITACQMLKVKEFSQEVRLSSDFDGMLNFVLGGFYGTGDISSFSASYLLNSAMPNAATGFASYFIRQKGWSRSAYGQLVFKPIEQIEIDIGGRYSEESKRLPDVFYSTSPANILNAPLIVKTLKRKFDDFSPEVTASWRPDRNKTLFASYKEGFLSGGFNVPTAAIVCASAARCPENSYEQQTIRGVETGIKIQSPDGRFRGTLSAYSYKTQGMQLSTFIGVVNITQNAGTARLKGLEGELNYRTPIDGLDVRATAAYNKADYVSYGTAPCWPGQTIVQRCTVNGSGVTTQDLSGQRLPRAPRWNLSGGFSYDVPLSSVMTAVLASDVRWSSDFFTDLSNDTRGRQPSYTLLDASLTLKPTAAWDFAFIGRNLTNTYYYTLSIADPFSGSGTGTSAGVLGDRLASVSRGRELMFRLSYRFQ